MIHLFFQAKCREYLTKGIAQHRSVGPIKARSLLFQAERMKTDKQAEVLGLTIADLSDGVLATLAIAAGIPKHIVTGTRQDGKAAALFDGHIIDAINAWFDDPQNIANLVKLLENIMKLIAIIAPLFAMKLLKSVKVAATGMVDVDRILAEMVDVQACQEDYNDKLVLRDGTLQSWNDTVEQNQQALDTLLETISSENTQAQSHYEQANATANSAKALLENEIAFVVDLLHQSEDAVDPTTGTTAQLV